MLSGSFLYWQSKVGNLEFAVVNRSITNPTPTTFTIDGKEFTPDFSWEPGYKVEMGYTTTYDNWDVLGRYTYYFGELTHIKRTLNSTLVPAGLGVAPLHFYPFIANPAPSPVYSYAHDKWQMNYNFGDLELGRFSLVNPFLKCRLFGGLKGGRISQSYKIEYGDGITLTNNNRLLQSNIAYKSTFWGIGPRVGANTSWKIVSSWNLLADSSFSLLFSRFNVERRQIDQVLQPGGTLATYTNTLPNKFFEVTPVLQMLLGTDFGICFGKINPLLMKFLLAYELNYFFRQNQMRKFVTSSNPGDIKKLNGDLQLHGLTFTLLFQY